MQAYERSYVDSDGREHRHAAHHHDADERILCAHCDALVPGCRDCARNPPAGDDDEAWAELAFDHHEGCEWIANRAYHAGFLRDCDGNWIVPLT